MHQLNSTYRNHARYDSLAYLTFNLILIYKLSMNYDYQYLVDDRLFHANAQYNQIITLKQKKLLRYKVALVSIVRVLCF